MDANEIAKAFGQTLRNLRRDADLTQEKLALAADLQRNYVSELELGLKQPSVHTLFKLAKALDISPGQFAHSIESELYRSS